MRGESIGMMEQRGHFVLESGHSASHFAREQDIPLISLAHRENRIWVLEDCPLCASHVPLERV